MIDLNGQEFKEVSIFNNGKAGLVTNVKLEVAKKDTSDTSGRPDFDLVFTDDAGAKLRHGFYYFKPMPNDDNASIQKKWTREVGRLLHVARAVMGKDFKFPPVNSQKEAYDTIFKLISENSGNQLFNVFATYGTTNYVNKGGYLKLRYFDFIENANQESRLKVRPTDLLERIVPDEEVNVNSASMIDLNSTNAGSASVQSWTS